MSKSSRFRSLEKQLALLRKYFLPVKLDPIFVYNSRQTALARAYRVLSHAEIEAYVEERVAFVVKHSLSEWKRTGRVNRTILGLVAFCGKTMDVPPDTLSPQKGQEKSWLDRVELNKKIDSAAESFFYALRENHGIKEANILRLVIPIGVDQSSLDPAWLADMNSFGAMRGEAAHLSQTSPSVKNTPHPVEELARVNSLLNGLLKLDEEVEKLMK